MAARKLSARQRQALKELCGRQGTSLAHRMEANKEAKRAKRAIRTFLAGGPATVPRIATATDLPTDRALWFVTAMKKYGEIREEDQDGDYVRYALTEEPSPGESGQKGEES